MKIHNIDAFIDALGISANYREMMRVLLYRIEVLRLNRPTFLRVLYGSKEWDRRSHYEKVMFGQLVRRLVDQGRLPMWRDPTMKHNHHRYWLYKT